MTPLPLATEPASWQPLLEGELAQRAHRIVDDIVAALRELDGLSLTDLSGCALLFAHLHRARPNQGFDALSSEYLDRAIAQLGERQVAASLFGGFVGLAWLVDHLDPTNPDDANEEIDEALLQLLETSPWPYNYDLISGLAGFGVYALGRIARPRAREILARVVRQLDALAEPRGPGLSWLSRPELLLPETAKRWPRGYYNYGIAHGAPAVALVMAGALRAGIESERARKLYEGAQRWIWAGRLPDGVGSAFGSWEVDDEPTRPTRLAWCYGDAGMAATLFCAARTVGDEPRVALALDVGARSALRRVEHSGVVDAALCHGSAGLAVIYARLHQQTGDERFANAARRWLGDVLDRHRPGRGIGGYQAEHPDGPIDEPSFLQGSIGIALTLLAGVGVEPTWDRQLALSLPEVRS